MKVRIAEAAVELTTDNDVDTLILGQLVFNKAPAGSRTLRCGIYAVHNYESTLDNVHLFDEAQIERLQKFLKLQFGDLT